MYMAFSPSPKPKGKSPGRPPNSGKAVSKAKEPRIPADIENSGHDNSYNLFMREAVQHPLLSPNEEIELHRQMHRGKTKKIRNDARERMICSNLRLVVKIASDYKGSLIHSSGIALIDLINEGNIGLMKSVDRFDPKKGGKLSTYAAWWIKQSVKRALCNNLRSVRIPVHMVDKIYKMTRQSKVLEAELGREPTDLELAERLDIPVRKVERLKELTFHPTSLNQSMGDGEDGSCFGDVVADEAVVDPSQTNLDEANKELIWSVVSLLPEREKCIIEARFGLYGDESETLESLGQKWGITRERIRQLQNMAMAKMRKMIQNKELNGVPISAYRKRGLAKAGDLKALTETPPVAYGK
jgi:RNA polymerase primary sigma factor